MRSTSSRDSDLRIFVTGRFPYVAELDPITLDVMHKHTLREDLERDNCRIDRIEEETSGVFVAVSEIQKEWTSYDPSTTVLRDLSSSSSPMLELHGGTGNMFGLKIVPSGDQFSSSSRVVAGDSARKLLVWNSVTGKLLFATRLRAATKSVLWIEHVPEWNSQRIFVAGGSGGNRPFFIDYDLERGPLGLFVGTDARDAHHDNIFGLCPSVSKKMIASVSLDLSGRIWSIDSRNLVKMFKMGSPGFSVSIFEDRNLLLAGLSSGIMQFWDLRRLQEAIVGIPIANSYIFEIEQFHEDQALAVSSASPSVFLDNISLCDEMANVSTILSCFPIPKVRCTASWKKSCCGCCVVEESDDEFEQICDERISFILEIDSSGSIQTRLEIMGGCIVVLRALFLPSLDCLTHSAETRRPHSSPGRTAQLLF